MSVSERRKEDRGTDRESGLVVAVAMAILFLIRVILLRVVNVCVCVGGGLALLFLRTL